MDDPRGNLMLTYLAIAKQYRPNWLVWENVPGVLSSNGGRDFGSFLGGLAECGYGFAYRVLDAQFFGVAQRRRRVFVVGYLGDWRAAAAVLFERHSLQGHPAPSREKRQSAAASVGAGAVYGGSDQNTADTVTSKWAKGSGGPAGNECGLFVAQPIVIDRAAFNQGENAQYKFKAEHSETIDTLLARGPHAVLQPIAFDAYNQTTSDTVTALRCAAGGVFDNTVAQPIPFGVSEKPDVGHCLRSGASKADKHESTTYVAQPISFDMAQITSKVNGTRVEPGLPVSTLAKGSQMHVAIAQPICLMDQGGSVMNVEHDMVGTLRRETHGHEPIVAQPVYSFIQASAQKKSTNSVLEELSNTLTARAENNNFAGGLSMAVRRLTPVECERLQGFPDTYTDIMSKGKATPDGPRYKALGNSMAVPVMAWIGNRIQQVESLKI